MTISDRDYFAAMKMVGIGQWTPDFSMDEYAPHGSPKWEKEARSARARYCYAEADAMLAARQSDAQEEAAKAAEVEDWKARAEFAEAQLDAVLEQLPPPEAGLLKKRLAERAARPRTPAP